MKFWDSSALVPLLVSESTSGFLEDLFRYDADVVLWWATPVECVSALARIPRERKFSPSDVQRAHGLLDLLLRGAFEVQPDDEIRKMAQYFVGKHRLRAADSLQLAAAIFFCEEQPRGFSFVCLDDRLSLAAMLEGFRVEPWRGEVHERRYDPDFDD